MKKKKKLSKSSVIIFLVLSAFVLIAAACAAFWYADAPALSVSFPEGKNYVLEYGTDFVRPEPQFFVTGRITGEHPVEAEYTVNGVADGNTFGVYALEYNAAYKMWTASDIITVEVKDTVPPVIELISTGHTGEVSWMTGYEEEGFSASDNHDGDITDYVSIKAYPDKIVYTVKDSSGNIAEEVRSLENVLEPPVFEMNGFEEQTVYASRYYKDPGCTAVDGLGNDLTEYITVEGEVIPYVSGDYEIKYSIENMLGEVASASRIVHVIPVQTSEMEKPEQKTIYLTFDDGPSVYTEQLLDILDKYNAKATFFVTGNSEYRSLIGEAYRRGHAIGVHTYCHEYNKIYASEDAFYEDFFAMQEVIKEQTGEYTNLYRFPGGSSNTISNFNKGIISRLAQQLTDMGYYYFDWNVISGDAGDTTKTSVVKQNVIDGCSGFKYPVVLQHDIKGFSVAAVEDILIWGHDNGYVFSALSETSPSAHHTISN